MWRPDVRYGLADCRVASRTVERRNTQVVKATVRTQGLWTTGQG